MSKYFKQQLFLDSTRSTLVNGRYRFDIKHFRIREFKLKKYIVNGIADMTDITYVCCPQLAESSINRNSDCGLPSDIIGVITDQFQSVDIDRHTMFLENEKHFKHLDIYFKKSNANGTYTVINPTNFLVVLDISKET